MTVKAAEKKPKSLALAKALLEAGIEADEKVFIVKSPMADTPHAADIRSKRGLFGVAFNEGVAVTTDAAAVQRIRDEFPAYIVTEMN